jgi:hypothetical protein
MLEHRFFNKLLEGRRRQYIYFVRSWTGFCAYKARVEQINNIARITEAWASCQFGRPDAKEVAEILGMVIAKRSAESRIGRHS